MKFKILGILMSAFVFGTLSTQAQAANYSVDHSHSTIGFAVGHMSVGKTRGSFNDYKANFYYDPSDLSSFTADVSIDVNSIDTKNEGRDNHLRSPDFFDTTNFPKITFKSNRLEKRGGGHVIVGDLTIRDVTKQLTIPVQLAGPVDSPMGFTAMGITAETVINRQDFGVSWSKSLDSGGLVVDDMVTLVIEIEAHMKDSPKKAMDKGSEKEMKDSEKKGSKKGSHKGS